MSWPEWFPREGEVVERLRLDVKREYAASKDDVAYDIAKDIAAMANAVGGRIVLGATEVGPARRWPGESPRRR